MLFFVICRLTDELPYEQLKTIVENTPDTLWTAAVPKNKELVEKVRKSLKLQPQVATRRVRGVRSSSNSATNNYPAELDWRKAAPGCAARIRDQENCGACWAFASVASFGTRDCIARNDTQATQFSEQFMISCDQWDDGCNGGFLDSAQDFLVDTGLIPDSCVAFKSGSGYTRSCPTKCDNGSVMSQPVKASTYKDVCETHDTIIAALQKGPVTTQMEVYQDFMVYESGIYHHIYGDLVGYHAVSIVGYGVTDEKVLYWIVQNSWGEEWGMNGYFHIIRSINECNMEEICYAVDF